MHINDLALNMKSVTADGVKTYSEALNELYNNVGFTNVKHNSYIIMKRADGSFYKYTFERMIKSSNTCVFIGSSADTNLVRLETISLSVVTEQTTYHRMDISSVGNTYTDNTSGVMGSGTIIELHY